MSNSVERIEEAALNDADRVLRISFQTRAELDREYEANLVNGGLLIREPIDLPYGESVLVLVDLPFAKNSVELEGYVVQSIPFETNRGRCGVAIELSCPPSEIRARLEAAISDRFEDESSRGKGSRRAARSVAHLRARVRASGVDEIEGRTRNLSLAGVLVAISDEAPPVGHDVTVAIIHPVSGEGRAIPGVIVRHELDPSGQARGLGIQFRANPALTDETVEHLNQVKASEHARRLGGITGSIDTLGLNELIMSFGRCVPRGRFSLVKAGEVGTIYVEGGLLMSAQVGAAIGLKALVRMAGWEEGEFDFQANPDCQEETEGEKMSLPIEMALLEAARLIDESRAQGESGLPRNSGLCVDSGGVDLDDPERSKIDAQIIDLAGAGMSISRILDSIQEPDGSIEGRILALIERGVVELDSDPSQD